MRYPIPLVDDTLENMKELERPYFTISTYKFKPSQESDFRTRLPVLELAVTSMSDVFLWLRSS